MGVVASSLQVPLLYSRLDSKSRFRMKVLMKAIEQRLDKVNQSTQYRDKNMKVRFNLEWSFLLGHTCNALGAKSFETPHNFKPGRGVSVKPVEERRISKWKKELWKFSKELITLIDDDFADGEYVVNYACMTNPKHYVKKHTDSEDISYQYAMALGDYKGAFLRCYDEQDNILGDFDYHNKICKMDGRLPHELILNDFEGKRYCVVWFKTYDHRKTKADPIFREPCLMTKK